MKTGISADLAFPVPMLLGVGGSASPSLLGLPLLFKNNHKCSQFSVENEYVKFIVFHHFFAVFVLFFLKHRKIISVQLRYWKKKKELFSQ